MVCYPNLFYYLYHYTFSLTCKYTTCLVIPPGFISGWPSETTSIFSQWKITQLFGQMEDNLGTAQPQLVFASVNKCPKQSPFEIAQYPKVENLFVCPLCLPKACGKGYFENCTSFR